MKKFRCNHFNKFKIDDIWECDSWKEYYLNKCIRKGIRLDFERDVNEDVKKTIKDAIAWLRTQYEFPIRIRIYVKKAPLIRAKDGEMIPDLFFWPSNRCDEPYIKIATGDYNDLLQKMNSDDALSTILFALFRELTHYYQWINELDIDDPNLERQAILCAKKRLRFYTKTKEHLL